MKKQCEKCKLVGWEGACNLQEPWHTSVGNKTATVEINAFIIINPKTGRHENSKYAPEIHSRMVDTEFPKKEKCVPCVITYQI